MELIRTSPTERLDFPDGNWVDLKARLTIAERKGLAAGAIRVEGGPGGRMRPAFDAAAVEMAALNIGIVAWSLPDPVTPENIALLDEDTGMAIKQRLDELWKPLSDDDRKNSSGGTSQPSPAREGDSPPSSAG